MTEPASQSINTRCGYIAIVGRPNVGKSTLLNQILKKKVSITSRKPQTTRHNLLGIRTQNHAQAIYVDTPGIQRETKTRLNRYMNRVASQSLVDVDVVLFVVEALSWREEDALTLKKLKMLACPVLLVVNKIDSVKDKAQLLPYLDKLNAERAFQSVFFISAKTGKGVNDLETVIQQCLPVAPYLFPEASVTDRQGQFMASEMIREQLMRHLGDELPYALTVGIEQFKQEDQLLRIYAVIYVEKAGQKAIVIGKGGEGLKQTGTKARESLEAYFGMKVFLQLWVKVKPKWTNDPRWLKAFGYEE